MPKTLLLTLMLVLCIAVDAIVHETGDLEQFLFGSEPACEYDNWISHVSENIANNGLNHYAPWDRQTTGFGSYLDPDLGETALWSQAVNLFYEGAYDQAQQVLTDSGIPYEIVLFDDTQTHKSYYILRETLNDDIDDNGTEDPGDDEIGSFDFGWGIYIYDPGSLNPVIVTAPHPCDDYPSPLMAWEAFTRWNARWLMINGAGREVAFYGTGYGNNNQSLSDPSRNSNHPLNVVYQKAANEIRSQFGREEFSAQIHTYDPFRPTSQRDVQLSAGNGRNFPTLPIRDFSRGKNDIIHNTPYTIHTAGAFGNLNPVTISQYYSVYYAQGDTFYYTGNGMNLNIANNRDYPGSAQNCQMIYTEQQSNIQTWNPFLHVEMGELPQTLRQDEETFYWFYGYDSETETWNPEQRYTRFKAYYMPWLNAMTAALPALLRLDDEQIPSTPEGLYATTANGYLKLGWQRSYAYDFDSYEIHYSYIQNGEPVSGILDRDDDSDMGKQDYALDTIPYLEFHDLSSVVTYRIRARDIHGNYSEFSNPLSCSYPSSKIQALSISSMYDRNFLSWSGNSSSVTTLGYNVYRSRDGFTFSLLDTYLSNPALSPPSQNSCTYSDVNVIPGKAYYYKVGRVYEDGTEYLHYKVIKGSPLVSDPLFATNLSTGERTSFYFGMNPFATNAVDQVLDQGTSGLPTSPNFLFCSTTPDSLTYLYRDLRPVFDPSETYTTFDLVMRCPYPGMDYQISLPDSVSSSGDRFLLLDLQTRIWTDLSSGDYTLTGVASGVRNFRFYWGHYLPEINLPLSPDIYGLPHQQIPLSWSVTAPNLIDHYQIMLIGTSGEILVYDNLPPALQSVDYTVPVDPPLSSGRFRLIAFLTDGTSISRDFPWQIHFAPGQYPLNFGIGAATISFPTSSMYSTMIDTFGNDCRLWTFTEQGYWATHEELLPNVAYLARFNLPFAGSIPNIPVLQPVAITLHQGLNFVPNPHQRDYRLVDLRYSQNGTELDPVQTLSSGMIVPAFLVIRNGTAQLADTLRTGESGFIFVLRAQPLTITFEVATVSDVAIPIPRSWQVRCKADNGSYATEVVIGSSVNATDTHDPRYDIPESLVPELPFSLPMFMRLFYPPDDDDMPYLSRFTGLFPDYDTVTRTWDLELFVPSPAPLTLCFSSEDFPPNYSLSLDLDGQHFVVTPNRSFVFAPSATGSLYGTITVTSNPAVSNDDPVEAISWISVYPNPSRDVLHLDVPQFLRGKLDLAIYNLRGQRVRQLNQNAPSDSGSAFWDGKDEKGSPCAPGVYFLRAVIGSKSRNIKFLRL